MSFSKVRAQALSWGIKGGIRATSFSTQTVRFTQNNDNRNTNLSAGKSREDYMPSFQIGGFVETKTCSFMSLMGALSYQNFRSKIV